MKINHFFFVSQVVKHNNPHFQKLQNWAELRQHSVSDKQSFGPRQANLVLIAYASSEGSGEPAHSHSLARTFAARSYKQ